jgi:hypothetical protein
MEVGACEEQSINKSVLSFSRSEEINFVGKKLKASGYNFGAQNFASSFDGVRKSLPIT